MAYSQAVADEICRRLAEGESLRAAARAAGVGASTFLGWCDADKAVAEQYAQARARGIDLQFEELDDLIDTQPYVVDGKVDPGYVAWRRLQIDTRKWALSKRAPKKYGDKLDVEHGGKIQLSLADELAALRGQQAEAE